MHHKDNHSKSQPLHSESAISFAEYKNSITGEVATVLMDRPGGRKAVVAYIREDYDANAGKKSYRTFDVDGKEIVPANYSLTHLKNEIRRSENVFHEQVNLKEQALQQDFATEERNRLRQLTSLRSNASRTKSRTR